LGAPNSIAGIGERHATFDIDRRPSDPTAFLDRIPARSVRWIARDLVIQAWHAGERAPNGSVARPDIGTPVHRAHVRPATMALAILIVLWSAGYTSAQTAQSTQSPGSLKKLTLDQLQEIEVTSVSKRPERLSETPSSIQVITGEDIRRSGATSIPEALRLASNLHVAQIDSHDWAITARGFNNVSSNKLLVLIDGRAVYTPLHAGVYWDVQETLLEDIEQIEVISGPGATLWGDNAVNGVINIITKTARDTQGVLVTGGAGSELRGAVGVRYGSKIGADTQFRVYGRSFGRDSSALPGGPQAADNWHVGQGGFRLDWDSSPVNHVTLQSDIYDGRIAQLGSTDGAVSGGNVLGRWSHALSTDSDLSLQLYYDQTGRRQPGVLAEDLRTYDADFQHRFRVAKAHHIVWGLGYRASVSDQGSSAALSVLPPHLSRQWVSGFIQDEVALATGLRLTVGTKVEHNDYTGAEFQPSGRLAWTLPRRQMLWAAVSRAVRTPSQVDRGLFVPLPGTGLFFIAGGPDFVSEDLLAYEIGYRSEPYDKLSLTVSSFYNDYAHIRSLEQFKPPAPLPLVFANGQSGHSYGVELTAEYGITNWWRIRSGYTGLHLDIRPEPGSTDKTFGSTESHDPDYYGSLRQSLDLPARLELDLGFRYVGQIVNQTVPAYRDIDGRLGWRATPSVEMSIAGQNLVHRHHAEFANPATRREAERGVNGKLVFRF
jgi:iron complex outermembrane receptor protein